MDTAVGFSTDFCRSPSSYGSKKWPRLIDLYKGNYVRDLLRRRYDSGMTFFYYTRGLPFFLFAGWCIFYFVRTCGVVWLSKIASQIKLARYFIFLCILLSGQTV